MVIYMNSEHRVIRTMVRLVEKEFGVDLSDLLDNIEYALRNGRLFNLGFATLFDIYLNQTRRLIAEIGEHYGVP